MKIRDNKIVLTKLKFLDNVECPHCHSRYIASSPKIEIKCNKCKSVFQIEPNPNIFAYYMSIIDKKKAHNDEVIVSAVDTYEKDLLAIANLHRRYGNWEVIGPEKKPQWNEKLICYDCGFCKCCKQCTKCGTILKETEESCPKCKSVLLSQAYIPKFEKVVAVNQKYSKDICPYCKSGDIIYTTFKNKTKCPKCKGTNISERRRIDAHVLIIRRFKAFRLENLGLKG